MIGIPLTYIKSYTTKNAINFTYIWTYLQGLNASQASLRHHCLIRLLYMKMDKIDLKYLTSLIKPLQQEHVFEVKNILRYIGSDRESLNSTPELSFVFYNCT